MGLSAPGTKRTFCLPSRISASDPRRTNPARHDYVRSVPLVRTRAQKQNPCSTRRALALCLELNGEGTKNRSACPCGSLPSSPSLSLERISLLSLSIGAPRKFNKCAPLCMAILMACFERTDGRLFCQPVILVIAFVTHVDSVHLQQKGNDSTVAAFEFVFMPGVGLNISSRKIPSDVFMWRSFQCSNRLSMRRY